MNTSKLYNWLYGLICGKHPNQNILNNEWLTVKDIHADIKEVAIRKLMFPGSIKYWENRYKMGATSGPGSYGRYAEFKAHVINSFVKATGVYSVIEYGCGDGNQLSLFRIPHYIGLDVSETAIKMCRKRFSEDKTKLFVSYYPDYFMGNWYLFKADVTLSLDVIFHLVEDRIFETYMKHLFSSARKYVIIYSSDTDKNLLTSDPHCKNRKFTKWVENNLPEWKLIKKIGNRYPNESTISDFYIYGRRI